MKNIQFNLFSTKAALAAALGLSLLLTSCQVASPHHQAISQSQQSSQDEVQLSETLSGETTLQESSAALSPSESSARTTQTAQVTQAATSTANTSQPLVTSSGPAQPAETTAASPTSTSAAVTAAATVSPAASTAAASVTTAATVSPAASTTAASSAAAATVSPAASTAAASETAAATVTPTTTAAAATEAPAATTNANTQGDGAALSPGNNVLPGVKCFDINTVRDIILGRTGNTLGGKYVFLTFDDGINLTSTPRNLDVLAKEHVSATFFIVGYTVTDRTGPVLQRIAKAGHAVALHSFDHDYDHLYPGRVADPAEIKRQAQETLAAIRKYLGPGFSTRLWRYPGGHMSWNNMEAGDRALLDLGLSWIDWNGMGGLADIPSRRPKDVPGVLDYLVKSTQWSPTREVYVLLLHDTAGKLLIPEALPTIIKYYRDRGFDFAVLK